MSSKLQEILLNHIETLTKRLNDLEADNLRFKLELAEKIQTVERQYDEMYVVRGGELVGEEISLLKKFHQIVLDELDLSDENLFYQRSSDKVGQNYSQVDKMARVVLFYLLNKHIPAMSWKRIGEIYNTTITAGKTEYTRYLNNARNREIIDNIEAQFIEALRTVRPYDVEQDQAH